MSLAHNKTIGIFGLGKTGIAAYQALGSAYVDVCYDDKQSIRDDFANKFGLSNIGDFLDPRWQRLSRILVSPGISPKHQIFKIAAKYKIDITSDIDLLFEANPSSIFVSITGTNGKSTTTMLTSHVFTEAGLDYLGGGNVGIAALNLESNKTGYILELSSFQLDLLKSFQAKIAVLLNITPDHLDRYKTMEAYIASKQRIFSQMDDNGYCIIGVDNLITNNIAANLVKSNRKVIPISAFKLQQQGVAVVNSTIDNSSIIYDNIFEALQLELPFNKYLQGAHNRENIAACYAICRVSGIKPQEIIAAIGSFRGLPHRMEFIGSIKGINFYNDSKATNTDSASKSLASLDNIYWLAGGIVKDDEIDSLSKFSDKVKMAYFFGRDKEILVNAVQGKMRFTTCHDMEEAFNQAFNDASSDLAECKNILLAPACASFDQFDNFEHRGDIFRKLCSNKF
jgi:UDP-N-acetylmuramoylalanine--D-glutamate ligase